jgi:hypothetical protein
MQIVLNESEAKFLKFYINWLTEQVGLMNPNAMINLDSYSDVIGLDSKFRKEFFEKFGIISDFSKIETSIKFIKRLS